MQRIPKRTDSTLRVLQTFAHPTSPCSVCRILQLPDCLTEAGGEVGWENVWKTQGGAVPSFTYTVYILWADSTVYVWFLGQIYKSRRISTVASAPAAERIYFNAEIQIIVGAVWEL